VSAIVLDEDRADQALLLDLLNTTPVADGVDSDELDDRRAARAWLEARGGRGTAAELARVRQVRALLQSLVRGETSPAALAPYVRSIGFRPVVTDEGISWRLDVAADDRLATRAVLAWDSLRTRAPGRLRACANDECALFLIDRSKSNNARWCSMAVCGNRMKARRHYQRQRETRG